MEESAVNWIDNIGQYLEDNGVGTLATDIFYQGFSKTASNCITLLTAPGLPEISTLCGTMVLSRPELDIRVRNVDDSTSYAKAIEIHTLLNGKKGRIGTTRFKKINAVLDPHLLEIDDNNRFIYAVNFQLEINR